MFILKNELCKNNFEGHDWNNNDECSKCHLTIDEHIDMITTIDDDDLREKYNELGLEYEEDE
jgi:hypothetical protein